MEFKFNAGSLILPKQISNKGLTIKAFVSGAIEEINTIGSGKVTKNGEFEIIFSRSVASRKNIAAFEKEKISLRFKVYNNKGSAIYISPELKMFDVRKGIQLDLTQQPATKKISVKEAAMNSGLTQKQATVLHRNGVRSMSDLRMAEPAALAKKRAVKKAGITENEIDAWRSEAFLATVITDAGYLNAYRIIGIKDIRDLVPETPGLLKRKFDEAQKDGKITRGDIPPESTIGDTVIAAKETYSAALSAHLAQMAQSFSCNDASQDCCGESPALSMLSKPAFIKYLLIKAGLTEEQFEKKFHQSAIVLSCEPVSLVRLGIEVLFAALGSGDLELIDDKALNRVAVVYYTIVWQALLNRISLSGEVSHRKARELFADNMLPGASIATADSLAGIIESIRLRIDNIIDWLKDKSNGAWFENRLTLSDDVINNTWLIAGENDYANSKAILQVKGDWTTELNILTGSSSANRGQSFAIKFRDYLVGLTTSNASELREKYFVNFLATDGYISRCEQVVLTLEEYLICGQAWYQYCCEEENGVFTSGQQTRFKYYPEYRMWIEQLLYPQNFYDTEVKGSLVRGDITALKNKLIAAEQQVDADAGNYSGAHSSQVESFNCIFKKGFRAIDQLLDLDALIADGHLAYRDEEYGLAVSLYEQAAARIRALVKEYYSANLADYGTLFYGRKNDCKDSGTTYITNAGELCEKLKNASLQPAIMRSLIDNSGSMDVDSNGFWPPLKWPELNEIGSTVNPDNLIRSIKEFYVADGDRPDLTLFHRVILPENRTALLDEAITNKYIKFDYMPAPGDPDDRRRYSLPIIISQDRGDLLNACERIEEATKTFLIKIFGNDIKNDVQAYINGLNERYNQLRSCFVNSLSPINKESPSSADVVSAIANISNCINNFSNSVVADILTEINSMIGNLRETQYWSIRTVREEIVILGIRTGQFHEVAYFKPKIDAWVDGLMAFTGIDKVNLPNNFDFADPADWGNLATGIRNAAIGKLVEIAADAQRLFNKITHFRIAAEVFFNEVTGAIASLVISENRSVWGIREGAIQELSNMYQVEDVRSQSKFRRGSILIDKMSNDLPDQYKNFNADFTINTGDNDDIGIVFCYKNTGNNNPSYYRISFRHSKDDEVTRNLARIAFVLGYPMLLWGTTAGSILLSATSPLAQMVAAAQGLIFYPMGVMAYPFAVAAYSFAEQSLFPEDKATQFARLMKIDPAHRSENLKVLAEMPDFKIQKNKNYRLQVEVKRDESNKVNLSVSLSEPEGTSPLVSFNNIVDNNGLDPGGIGFYSFGNTPSIFKTANLTYYPSKTASLGELLFIPGEREGEKAGHSCNEYICRLTSSPSRLSKRISVNADDFKIMYTYDENAELPGDTIDLHLFDQSIPSTLKFTHPQYAPYADRFEIAQLLNELAGLLPHYYFFLLPLSIGDAYKEMGSYKMAKKHYDIIYDPFPNEIELINPGTNTSYGDSEERKYGYTYLHRNSDMQTGVEEEMMKQRHAGNFLAEGESDFSKNDHESKLKAYEAFEKVLLVLGTDSCCNGWEGQALCIPGAKMLHPAPGASSENNNNQPLKYNKPAQDVNKLPCLDALRYIVTALRKKGLKETVENLLGKIRTYPLTNEKKFCEKIEKIAEKIKKDNTEDIVALLNRIIPDDSTDFPFMAKDTISYPTRLGCLQELQGLILLQKDKGTNNEHNWPILLKIIWEEMAGDAKQFCKKIKEIISGFLKQKKTTLFGFFLATLDYNSGKSITKRYPQAVNRVVSVGSKRARRVAVVQAFMQKGISVAVTAAPVVDIFPGKLPVFSDNLPGIFAGNACEEQDENCFDQQEMMVIDQLTNRFSFIPGNPLNKSLAGKACMYLQSLDNDLNILGMKESDVSIYRYEFLRNMAQTFASFAINAEKDFIQFREKLMASRLSMMQQDHNLALLGAQQRLKQLGLSQAEIQEKISGYQTGMLAQRDKDLSDQLVLNDYAMGLAVLSGMAGIAGGAIGMATAGIGLGAAVAGIVAAPPTGGASLLVSVAGIGMAGLGAAGSVSAFGGSATGALQNVFSVYQQRVMLEQQQNLLRNYEIPIGNLSEQNAQVMVRMAEEQLRIGQLELDYAERVLTYMANSFLNADMYSFLARQSKKNYRNYLEIGTKAANLAEHALERQRGLQFNIVKPDYYDVSQQGLFGGESLLKDIETLDYQKTIRDERKQFPPVKFYSLASGFPLAFQRLKSSGKMWFTTSQLEYDRDFPGHFNRLIKSVRVNVLALSGLDGIKSTLTLLGNTQNVLEEDGQFILTVIPGSAQRVALSGSPDGRGLIPLNAESEKLNPFEDYGVAGTWLLEIPLHANSFDFDTIVDIQFIVEYTSYYSRRYHEEVTERLGQQIFGNTRPLSLKLNYPDSYYHLLNPGLSGPQYSTSLKLNLNTISFETNKNIFFRNEKDRMFEGLQFGLFDKNGNPFFTEGGSEEIYIASKDIIRNLWQKGMATKTLSRLNIAGKTRVLRGGDLIIVNDAEVRLRETASKGKWKRVLRNRQVIWLKDEDALVAGDEELSAIVNWADEIKYPLPSSIPSELIILAMIRSNKIICDTIEGTGRKSWMYEVLFHDENKPHPGMKRVLQQVDLPLIGPSETSIELLWVENADNNPGDILIANDKYTRFLNDAGDIEWKRDNDKTQSDKVCLPDDTWLLIINPDSLGEYKKNVSGFTVPDLKEVNDVILLFNYSYKLILGAPVI